MIAVPGQPRPGTYPRGNRGREPKFTLRVVQGGLNGNRTRPALAEESSGAHGRGIRFAEEKAPPRGSRPRIAQKSAGWLRESDVLEVFFLFLVIVEVVEVVIVIKLFLLVDIDVVDVAEVVFVVEVFVIVVKVVVLGSPGTELEFAL